MIEVLLGELERREALLALLDFVIESELKERVGNRLKKGVVHAFLAARLEVNLSPDFRRLANERMVALGHRVRIRDGYKYFIDIELPPE